MGIRALTEDQERRVVAIYTTPSPGGVWTGAKTIAREFGVRPQTIYNILHRRGIATRDAKEAYTNGKRVKPIKNLPPEGESPPSCKCGCGQAVSWSRPQNKWQIYVAGHYRVSAPYKNPDWLRAQYVTTNRTIEDIAAECGVNHTSILRYLKRFNIPRRNKSEARIGRHVGPSNPAWRGGATPERQRIYKTELWKSLVRDVFKRDAYTCQRCGSPKRGRRGLHAHHMAPWAENEALRFDSNNLITLCDKCHVWIHSSENVARELLIE